MKYAIGDELNEPIEYVEYKLQGFEASVERSNIRIDELQRQLIRELTEKAELELKIRKFKSFLEKVK